MSRFHRLLPYLLATLAACGGDPSGPTTGALDVVVSGLPSGTSAAVSVTGPGGYSHAVTASETLSGLMPGAYTVAANMVSGGGQSYQPAQSSQSVSVGGGAAPVSALVTYGPSGASLTVSVAGLPPGVSASISVTGPMGYDQPVIATTTLAGLAAGVYTVTAQTVSPAGAQYDPSSPSTQAVNLAAGASGSASVSYTSAASPGLNLRIDGMYLTQSVQTYGGGVPLVKDRNGFLRVFVTASQSNIAAPDVRVRFYSNGTLVSTSIIPAPALSVPLSPNEGSLSSSWNIPVPKALIQPNLSILADVDPANAVPETNEGDNAFPSPTTPLALDVRTTSAFSVRFVPIHQVNGLQGNVTDANKDSFLAAAMSLHPLAGYDADLHAPLSTTRPAVDANNANNAWTDILAELDQLRVAEGTSRYYYGVIDPSYNGGIAGVGYVGRPTALGWDKGSNDLVAAHEWGHNWGRKHAPCGTASDPDKSYPYAGGTIGVYGFDVAAQVLKPPSNADLMGYCNNEWISDYTYKAVLTYRSAQPDVATSFAQAMQPCLLVSGHIVDGQPVLEPAFQIVTRPSLPASTGPYQVEGRALDGSRLFGVSFTPAQVADDPRGGEYFAFALPLQPDRAARLDAIRLTAPGRPPVSLRAAPAAARAAPDVRIVRLGPDRVSLRWDAAAHPMLLVRDPATGQVLSFARGGQAEVATGRGDLDVQLSNGVAGRSVRVAVPR